MKREATATAESTTARDEQGGGGEKRGRFPLPAEVEKHLDWLLSLTALTPNGLLPAWMDGAKASYPYAEATGYLLSLLAYVYLNTGQELLSRAAATTARALAKEVTEPAGAGRDGEIFLFDTIACLRGFHDFLAVFTDPDDRTLRPSIHAAAERLALTARRMIAERSAGLALAANRPEHWSRRYNVHLIKSLHHFHVCRPDLLEADEVDRAIHLFYKDHYRDGFFHPEGEETGVYLHAHCYAMEGLVGLRWQLSPEWAGRLEQMGEQLTRIQLPNGALPRFRPPNGRPEIAVDTTAQAVRLWQCLDRTGFHDAIARALGFLATMTAPNGGVRYTPEKPHLNSWTTIFVVQALLWRFLPPEGEWIV